MIPCSSGSSSLKKDCQKDLRSSEKGHTDIFKIDTNIANTPAKDASAKVTD
jgi:hypothetical protein